MLEIYIHIPFCKQKCGYCDFNSRFAEKELIERYVKELIREIKESPHKGESVDTVFIGGGTPSFIEGEYIKDIMNALKETFTLRPHCEISMEANPESVDSHKLEIYKGSGINRISMGVQSFDDKELKLLGRVHDSRTALSSYYKIREAGFRNVNIDLMFFLPGQSLDTWMKTLKTAVSIKPEHISAYSLIIEEGTLFYKKYKNFQTNDKLYRIMYRKTKEILEAAGLCQYEISNFALPGYECRHNIGYWRRYNYLGFGLSAHSMYDNVRFSNTDSFRDYFSGKKENYREELSLSDKIGEFMFLGLRMTRGISLSEFKEGFGMSLEDRFGDVLKKYISMKLLETDGKRLWLTPDGIDVSNTIFAEFV